MASLAQFTSLEGDMSYEDVCEIFGERGTLISSETAQIESGMTIGSILTEVFEWSGQEGSLTRVMFKHGQLHDCTQDGLI